MTEPTDQRPPVIMATDDWPSNAELLADVDRLGYLSGRVLDATYGYGTFWKVIEPESLIGADMNPIKARDLVADFTRLPFATGSFDTIVFDPGYKLNGTPDEVVDARYGVEIPSRWQDRMSLIRVGMTECARVLGPGRRRHLLLKCQDQVCSGKVRWQSMEFTAHAQTLGLGLVDRFDFPSYRPQPLGKWICPHSHTPHDSATCEYRTWAPRQQVHAHGRGSSLLVFRPGWWTSDLPRTNS